ncbi:zinc-binding dehydrogenase [Luteitalea sp.]|uniref:zinc-binding dehydrogenase n=1 Tax=Luteitalea sp. TaxID=2004800 RepID=UPI00345764B5
MGLAAPAIARTDGAQVAATSRQRTGEASVCGGGADHFFLDDGAFANAVRRTWQDGADKVLELAGTATLADSIAAVREPGGVCTACMVGDRCSFADFAPMDVIPTSVSLTPTRAGRRFSWRCRCRRSPSRWRTGRCGTDRPGLRPKRHVEAHPTMESNIAGGRIVVVTHRAPRTT